MIDESEVLTPADPFYHIAKNNYTVPFVCGCTNLGEAVRRVAERCNDANQKVKQELGNVVSAVQHARLVANEIAHAQSIGEEGRSEMVDIIMQGFQRVNKVSSFNLNQIPLHLEQWKRLGRSFFGTRRGCKTWQIACCDILGRRDIYPC